MSIWCSIDDNLAEYASWDDATVEIVMADGTRIDVREVLR